MTHTPLARRWPLTVSLITLLLAGCLATKPSAVSEELPFDQAVDQATDLLVGQTQKLPAFLSKVEAKLESRLDKRGIVVDSMLEAASGQQTAATQALEKRVTGRLGTQHNQFELLPFQAGNVGKAHYLLTGTMARLQAERGKPSWRINLALTDLKTGGVVAQASAVARDEGLDNTPLAYYRDSPVLVKDKVIEGYVATTAAKPGERGDAF